MYDILSLVEEVDLWVASDMHALGQLPYLLALLPSVSVSRRFRPR